MDPFKIELTSKDRTFSYYTITGLSVKEMNRIFDPQDDGSTQEERLATIIDSHTPNLGTQWLCGYGICSIKHVGGHLLLTVGNSCD